MKLCDDYYDYHIYLSKKNIYELLKKKVNNNLKIDNKKWTLEDSCNLKKVNKKKKVIKDISKYLKILNRNIKNIDNDINSLFKESNIKKIDLYNYTININDYIKNNILNSKINNIFIKKTINDSNNIKNYIENDILNSIINNVFIKKTINDSNNLNNYIENNIINVIIDNIFIKNVNINQNIIIRKKYKKKKNKKNGNDDLLEYVYIND